MFKRLILFCTLLLIIHLPLFQAKQGDYFRGPSALSYCDSVEYCQRNGGELAVIRNKDQNKAAADICIGDKNKNRLRTTKTNVPCWLGLTEYVGTKNTEIDYQLWIWRDGNASTLPKGRVDKPRTYSLGYMDDMNHTTSKENNKKGVPLSSYEYTNWKKIEPNNNMGCSESHAYMGSDTANLGKWYDTNAQQNVKYLPLCENTIHENPIHGHQCDTTFSNCWYEQCRNTDVGQDNSKCWSKKDSTSPKCSESATPKYTELEMKYDGEVYVEYTCCDDNDDSGREKHGKCYDDNDDGPRPSNGSSLGATFGLIFAIMCLPVTIFSCCAYKIIKDQKKEKEKNIKKKNEILDTYNKHISRKRTEAKVDSSLSADISSKSIPVENQPLKNKSVDHVQNKSVDLVHAMLARRLKKDKTFHKYMDKVDKDESGSLSSKEWRRLLAKLKKKDHASDSWELTSDIVKLTFKLVLASTGSNDDELTYAGLQAWVLAETEAKVGSALSTDISSWGRNSSVVVHPQVKAPAPTTINEMKDAITKMYRKYAPEKLSDASFVDHFVDHFIEQHGKEKLWSELCQIIEKKYDCDLNDFHTAKAPDEVVMSREAVIWQSRYVKIDKMSISTNEYKTVCGRHYTGELDENGIANGRGTMRYSGGAKYIGEYKNDKRHGQGVQYFADGSVYYKGEWRDGRRLHPPYYGYYSEKWWECKGCCVPDKYREKDKTIKPLWQCFACLFCLPCDILVCIGEIITDKDMPDNSEHEGNRERAREPTMQSQMYSEMYSAGGERVWQYGVQYEELAKPGIVGSK